jgi:two-component system, OmpR family, response regulator VicR
LVHPLSTAAGSPPPPIVLIVEDDCDTVELFQTYLKGSGYWVATAQTSDEGCRTFDELQPDIVVTDLGLPGRSDGLQMIEHVVNGGPRRVPVIVVTGHERTAVPHTAAANVANILIKPVPPDELELEVRRTRARARQARQRSRQVQQQLHGLIDRSRALNARALEIQQRVERVFDTGACPRCGTALRVASEPNGAPAGYHYFQPCPKGCGRFFRDRRSGRYYRLP